MPFHWRTVEFDGEGYRYAAYVPQDSRPPRPTILYLHGLGRGGRDGEEQTHGGLGGVIRESDVEFPFLVAFPQSPEDREFVGPVASLCLTVLERIQAEFGGDVSRTYLVGGSMGGHGAYHLAVAQPQRFAGLVVSCASPRLPSWRREQTGPSDQSVRDLEFDAVAKHLHSMPTWIFHGALDDTVSVAEARQMVASLRSQGNAVRYTEYPDAGHESCSRAFREPGVWTWLASQRLATHGAR